MMKRIVASFKPHGSSGSQVLGILETEIMRVLWKRGESSGRSVLEEVCSLRKVAYTTVLTIISRLIKKGFVKRVKKERLFVYSPSLTEKEFNGWVAKEVLRGLVNLSLDSTIAAFVDVLPKIEEEQIEELSRLIEESMEGRRRDGRS